jgi:hypothetical protein
MKPQNDNHWSMTVDVSTVCIKPHYHNLAVVKPRTLYLTLSCRLQTSHLQSPLSIRAFLQLGFGLQFKRTHVVNIERVLGRVGQVRNAGQPLRAEDFGVKKHKRLLVERPRRRGLPDQLAVEVEEQRLGVLPPDGVGVEVAGSQDAGRKRVVVEDVLVGEVGGDAGGVLDTREKNVSS